MTNKKSKPSGFIDLNKKNIYNIYYPNHPNQSYELDKIFNSFFYTLLWQKPLLPR